MSRIARLEALERRTEQDGAMPGIEILIEDLGLPVGTRVPAEGWQMQESPVQMWLIGANHHGDQPERDQADHTGRSVP